MNRRLIVALIVGAVSIGAAIQSYVSSMITGCFSCDVLALRFFLNEQSLSGKDFPQLGFSNFEGFAGWVDGVRGADLMGSIFAGSIGIVVIAYGFIATRKGRAL